MNPTSQHFRTLAPVFFPHIVNWKATSLRRLHQEFSRRAIVGSLSHCMHWWRGVTARRGLRTRQTCRRTSLLLLRHTMHVLRSRVNSPPPPSAAKYANVNSRTHAICDTYAITTEICAFFFQFESQDIEKSAGRILLLWRETRKMGADCFSNCAEWSFHAHWAGLVPCRNVHSSQCGYKSSPRQKWMLFPSPIFALVTKVWDSSKKDLKYFCFTRIQVLTKCFSHTVLVVKNCSGFKWVPRTALTAFEVGSSHGIAQPDGAWQIAAPWVTL